jgi:hypothetical protein
VEPTCRQQEQQQRGRPKNTTNKPVQAVPQSGSTSADEGFKHLTATPQVEFINVKVIAAHAQHQRTAKLAQRTIMARCNESRASSYVKRSPIQCKLEDVSGFQGHLASSGPAFPRVNTTSSALRFSLKVTLDHPDLGGHVSTVHEPRKAQFLSSDEVARFLEAAPDINTKRPLQTLQQAARFSALIAGPRDHSVRFPNSAAFVAGSLQGIVGDFRPKLFQRPRSRLVRVPFGIIRSPRHRSGSRKWLAFHT